MFCSYLGSAVGIVALQRRHECGAAQLVSAGRVNGLTLCTKCGRRAAAEERSGEQEARCGGAFAETPPIALHRELRVCELGLYWLYVLIVTLCFNRVLNTYSSCFNILGGCFVFQFLFNVTV